MGQHEITLVRVTKDSQGEFRYQTYFSNGEPAERSEEGFQNLQYVIDRAHDIHPDAKVHVQYGEMDYFVDFTE